MAEETKMSNGKKNSDRWMFFFIGLAAGIGLTVSVFFLNTFLPEEKRYITSVIKTDVIKEDKPATLLQGSEDKTTDLPKSPPTDPKTDFSEEELAFLDTIEEIEFPELDYEEVEFFIDTEVPEEIQLFDQIVGSRRITIIDHSILTDSLRTNEMSYHTFEVQQWSTPIRNRITYSRKDDILKIKGIDINNVEIFYRDGEYYLQYKNSHYAIPANETFERLQEKNSKQ